MINIDDLKDRFKSEWAQTVERFNENPLVEKVKDRFENLNSIQQKLVLFGCTAFLLLIVFSVPWGWYSNSSDTEAEYLAKRDLIRELFKTQKESMNVPNIPLAPSPTSLKSRIEDQLSQEIRLLPEQIVSVDTMSASITGVPPQHIQGGVIVQLDKLNIRQAIDIGKKLVNISPSVKMKDFNLTASSEKAGYFKVSYFLVSLNVPDLTATEPSEEPDLPPKKGRR